MMPGVYKIENTDNGKLYIGSSKNVSKRLKDHKYNLRRGKHYNIILQRAWDKHGENAFRFLILIRCSKVDKVFFEQRAIDLYDSSVFGYNIVPKARCTVGYSHTEITRAKISASLIGNKRCVGYKHTEEVNRANSLRNIGHHRGLGRKLSDACKRFISELHKGSKRTEETKKKMSIAQKGRTISPEHRKKLSAARKGVPWTENRWAAQEKWRKSHV